MSFLHRPRRIPSYNVPKVTALTLTSQIRPAGTLTQQFSGGSTPNKLQVGFYAQMQDYAGMGPGDTTGLPLYGVYGVNANFLTSAELTTWLNTVDALGATAIVNIAGDPPGFGANSAQGFNLSSYESIASAWFGHTKLRSMCAAGRCLINVADEPHHTKWDALADGATWAKGQATFTPQLVETICRFTKDNIPGPGGRGCYTWIRHYPSSLKSGWGGWTPTTSNYPVNGYVSLDMACAQYEGGTIWSQLKSPDTYYESERIIGLGLKSPMMTSFSHNIWNSGNRVTMNGVAACWDYRNDGASSGVVAGTVQNNSGYSPGDQVTCATLNADLANLKNLTASPAWIKKSMDLLFNNPNLPLYLMWTHPTSGLVSWALTGSTGNGIGYVNRDDYVSALDYIITKGQTRASAAAWLQNKP